LTRTIIGSGTEDGLTYLDIQYAGTPTASASIFIGGESTSEVVATNGQTWTSSFYVKLQAGSLSNTTIRLNIVGRQLGVGVVAGQVTATTITPTSAALKTQRASAARTMSSADVDRVVGQIEIEYTNAQAIDLTLRIAAPQLEQGAFPTSYIPTTSAAATRAADSAVVTPISSFYNQAEGTLFAEGLSYAELANRWIFGFTNSDASSFMAIQSGLGSGNRRFVITESTTQASISQNATGNRFAGAARTDDAAFYANSVAGTPDASLIMPFVDRANIGRIGTVNYLNGHLRKIAYYPRRLSNTLLQQLTT
jgi:hypothetical protein